MELPLIIAVFALMIHDFFQDKRITELEERYNTLFILATLGKGTNEKVKQSNYF